MMTIGLTYDLQQDPQDERQAEFDPPRRLEQLCAAVEALGHRITRLGNAGDLLAAVRTHRLPDVDMVLNIAEGAHGRNREAWVPTLLDLAGVRYVGSDPLALSIGLDKVACKRLAMACGLPTPRWMAVDRPQAIPAAVPLSFPVIVKPRYQGSGIGIDQGAVVHDPAALQRRARWLFDRWPEPVLVEEFVGEGELTVCLIGNPPTAYPAIQRPVHPRSRLSCHVVRADAGVAWETPLELTAALEADARRIALEMFDALGCRDMARVDVRADGRGAVWFLEINPLPSLDPEGSFGLLAEYCGVSYAQLIGRILEAADARRA